MTRRNLEAQAVRRAALGLAAAALVCAAAGSARADETTAAVPPQYRLPLPAGPMPGDGAASATEFFFRAPSSFTYDSLSNLSLDDFGGPLDRARATLRYTWLSNASWAMKVGLSTALDSDSTWQRLLAAATEHPRVAGMPAMHVSGQGQLSERWLLSVDAEGLRTARGQSLDMDLRVDYHLSPDLALFGSYRLTDNTGDSAETYGLPLSNSARVGVQLRF